MSMELIVILAAAHAPDTSSWNQALSSAKVPATITYPADLLRHTGFLPVTVNGNPTGFEFSRSENFSELAAHYPAVAELKVGKPVVYSLIYHGDFQECAAVFYSASVLVSKFGGVALETQAGVLLNESELIDGAKQCQKMDSDQQK